LDKDLKKRLSFWCEKINILGVHFSLAKLAEEQHGNKDIRCIIAARALFSRMQFNDSHESVVRRDCAMSTGYKTSVDKKYLRQPVVYKHLHNDLQECSRYLACHAYFMRPRRTACVRNNIRRNMIIRERENCIFLSLHATHCVQNVRKDAVLSSLFKETRAISLEIVKESVRQGFWFALRIWINLWLYWLNGIPSKYFFSQNISRWVLLKSIHMFEMWNSCEHFSQLITHFV